MSTTTTPLPKQPHCSLSLDQVRESGLLSPERMAAVEAEIERRISIPRDEQGRPIETARLADLSPWPRYLYPRMDHDHQWEYLRREIMAVVLTEEERQTLDRYALAAISAKQDAAAFEKARKVPAAEWSGGVFWGDDYFASVEEALEAIAEVDDALVQDGTMADMAAPVRYLWGAKGQRVIANLDVADLLQCRIEDRGWEDMSVDDLDGVADLQKALDAFAKANARVVSHWPDYTMAIILNATTDGSV